MLDIFVYMQIPAETLILIITIGSLIFLIAPAFLLLYVNSYNDRKKRDAEERLRMQKTFEAEMLRASIEVREQTMQTIGADLHDNVGQLLGLTALTLRSVDINNTEKASEKISTVDGLISKSIAELRQLGKVIEGDQLVSNGIVAAIEYEVAWLKNSGAFAVHFFNETGLSERNGDKDLILFRLLQEVLNNIVRHAKASVITIMLRSAGHQLELLVRDNGIGFNGETAGTGLGMGLQNMKKRAGVIGGELSVAAEPGHGTEVNITIPYP